MAVNKSTYLVELYYDVMSPFSWIGFEGILRYQKRWPISIQLRPFWLREIFVATGNKSPVAVPNKAYHMIKELELQNDFWGLDLHYPKDFKKWIGSSNTSSERAMKILIAIQKEKPELLERVSRGYWTRLWSKGKPIFSERDNEEVLDKTEVGSISYWLKRSEAPVISQMLTANSYRALSFGCFGAPWYVVHKEDKQICFFGSDRFHLIGHTIGETM